MKRRGIAVQSEGAWVIPVAEPGDRKEMPPCILVKSDGSSIYATTDLATLVQRMQDWNPDKVLYVTDKRQNLHFEQVFRVAKKAGLVGPETALGHIGFGTMNGKDGKPFKTRDGGVLRLETLISDMTDFVRAKVVENKIVEDDQVEPTTRKIAMAALKYGDLSNQPTKDYNFDMERFAAFEGNTGPYILYTIVRVKSILAKYGDWAHLPKPNEKPIRVGGHTNGCRIGFDAGGSDRKVSAVIDGKTVYSEEVVWHPKTSEDPQYQYDGIVAAFKTAASKMPRVDGIGVSSAGVFIGNAPMVSSIFIKVPRARREEVKTVYDRAAREIGDVPIVVANDGDVSALAGSMSLGEGAVMGLAMGTSEAVGYVNRDCNILGWFSELAFAPVDLNESAMRDEWSGDIGVGCKYFSQDAVAKLAPAAGITLSQSLTPAEKLKEVQKLAEGGHPGALDIFRSIGVYLGHTLCLYERLYDIRNLIVLGRVASGVGGDLIVSECRRVLEEEYPEIAAKLRVMLPDENFRRVGQSMAAASLPEV